MTRSKFLAVSAAVAGALGLGVGAARAADPTPAELMQQIRQLQAKVTQMEAKQAEALSARDVDATVEKVIKDAEQRSQFLQMEGFTAGWQQGKGFRIQSADGNFVLHPSIQYQFRGVLNWIQSGAVTDTDGNITGFDGDTSTEGGLEVRRLKLGFDGNAFTPNLTYFFLWNTADGGANSGNLRLEQAWIKYFVNDDWATRVGQIVNPVFHEQTTSSKRSLAVDRSLTNSIITGTNEAFSQAVTLMYDPKDGPLTAEFGIEDGFISGNTDWRDGTEGHCGGFVRVNYFVKGARSEYEDFSAMGNKEDLLVIGGGVDATQFNGGNVYLYTVDAQWENTGGLGIYGAFLGSVTDDRTDTFNDWGVVLQAGYMLNDSWEAFGRVGYAALDSDSVPSGFDDTYCEFTVGVNWFIHGGHNFKLTVDLSVLPSGAPADFTSLGILASDDTEVILRGQLQLLL